MNTLWRINLRLFIHFLMSSQLKGSLVRVLDPLYFTPAANSTSYRKLYSLTLERCIEACKTRTWCTAINYQREWTRCDLIKHGSSGAGSAGETMTIKGNKADWDMVRKSNPCPNVIKLFPCSTELAIQFQLLIKTKVLNNKYFSCFQTLSC